MPKVASLPIEAGLLERFLEAEQGVTWTPVPAPPRPARTRTSHGGTGARARAGAGTRLAYYHDETARIERRSVGAAEVLTVTSGPVGALVLLGECARRGMPTTLVARTAGDLAEFPEGAIEARWEAQGRNPKLAVPFHDIVELARYALA